ncbi:EAL domain-containing protein [Curvibacter sp. CHRR-16]|uniref:EAL domain-containing protein n=1 Tax=Curvibacter sp. CHRR-16 TaxID=2835872 RepID=UPI002023B352|nr:EAL domain-containing protein [Curvibacter sp. CHRR-16]
MLIYLLDMTAVIYITGILIHEKLAAIEFTQKEVVGVTYTVSVRDNLLQALITGQVPPDDMLQRWHNQRAAQDAALNTAEQAERFDQALQSMRNLSAASRASAQADLLTRAGDLLTTVANQSNLILDPDLDSYYVMSLTMLRYPELLQLLQDSQTALRPTDGSLVRQAELLTVAGRLDAVVQGIQSDFIQTWKASDDGLHQRLGPSREALLNALKVYEIALQSMANASRKIDRQPKQAFVQYQLVVQQALDAAWVQGLRELDGLLQQRVRGLYTRMALHLGTALALLGGILSLVYLVASQIARPLRSLATVAERVRQTSDYTQRAQWSSSDEIGRLFAAFNDMLAQLDHDRLVQQELAASARAAEAQKALLEASPIPLVVTSIPDHRILHLNEPGRHWVGQWHQDPWRMGLEPGVRARFFQRLADRGVVDEFEVRWHAAAEPTWAVLSARRLEFQGQDAVITAFTPINVLKVMEQRLELWAKVFEASSEGITILNAERQVISVNAAFCRNTGYDYYEVIGEELTMLIEGDGPQWQAVLDKESWQGEVRFRRQSGDSYPAWLMVSPVREGGSEHPTHYIGIAIDITDRKAKEERIRFLAQHDVLTELPNRALCQLRLTEALEAARQRGEQVAVLFIDLDRFKLINDTLGHHIGDGLLRTVARRLLHAVRAHDTVSRLGGDEFIIIMRHVHGREELENLVLQRLIPSIRQPMVVEGHNLSVSCSVGVAIYPTDALDEDELMRRADSAMYEAKAAGRDTARYFSVETDQRILARQSMEAQLRMALGNGEFSLHFQPRLRASDYRMNGAEALLRWHNPALGTVSPSAFIQLAEETGLIKTIGPWVLQQACSQWASMLQEMRTVMPDGWLGAQLSVNLSAAQLADEHLVQQVAQALQRSGLSASLLELELTESHLMDNPSAAQQRVAALKKLGVQISIDDFGTGYSSLAYLKRFAIDKLKVDQSFVRAMLEDSADAAIVQAVIGLGHSLQLQVVAEGVETMATAQALKRLGCDELQGYGFARPMPEQAFLAWVRQDALRALPI